MPERPLSVQQLKINGGIWFEICSINFNDEDLLKSMADGIRMDLGDGKPARFWDDIWTEAGRLKDIYPRLFSLSIQMESYVGDRGFWDGIEWIWDF